MRIVMTIVGALTLFTVGCGNEIGDSCSLATDCSRRGTRICDTNSPSGYCTIKGCDFDTCPDEAVCVRFFPSVRSDASCSDDTGCSMDEICTRSGFCAPRTSEVRFCMKKCGGGGDCREDYECRDDALMLEHGGEPVTNPAKEAPASLPRFCATAPVNL